MGSSSIWAFPFTLEDIQKRIAHTLSSHLGISFTEIGSSHLRATMPVDERTLQSMGILHGGASAALAETVASVAANGCIDIKTKACVGIELNINHIRSVRSGSIQAVAKPLHLGKSTQVWEIRIENEQGLLTAISRLTLAVIDK